MAWILEWSGFENDAIDLQPWSKRLGTLKEMRRENTPCLLKSYFTCYKSLEMSLREPVSAVLPPSAGGDGGDGGDGGERKYLIFTSCCVIVPRVLTRVVNFT